MATPKATTNQRTTVSREFRTDASRPGALTLTLRTLATGRPGYGWFMAMANVAPSGVRINDDIDGDIPVIGMYAVLGDKQGISVTFDTAPNSVTSQKVSGQLTLSPDEQSGFGTFTFLARGEKATTVENVKLSAARRETSK
jgi:hypothetical protein